MKLLLKSIAFFASFALLCTSCAEDDTSDVVITPPTNTVVASSTIDDAIAGNGKVRLELSVPIDSNIKSYTISWTGVRTGSKEVKITTLDRDDKTGKVIFNDEDGYIAIIDTLSFVAAGDYNFTMENTCKSNCESAATQWDDAVKVYNESSYTQHPEPFKVEFTNDDDLEITWGEIPADFKYMTVAYVPVESEDNSTFEITDKIVSTENGVTTILGVKPDSEYKFTSYFRPVAAIDSDKENVSLTDEGATRVVPQSYNVQVAPQNVSVLPGNGRVMVTWDMPTDIDVNIDNTTIQIYKSNGTEKVGDAIVVSTLADSDNVVYINDDGASDAAIETLDAGDFIVKMWNTYGIKTDVDQTDPSYNEDGEKSEEQEFDVSVYSKDAYASAGPTPTPAYGGNVLVSWNSDDYKKNTHYSEFESAIVEYDGYTATVDKSKLSGFTEFKFSDGVTTIKYSYTFAPVGGVDKIVVVDGTNNSLGTASSCDIDWNGSYSPQTTKFEGKSISKTRAKIMTSKGLKAFADLVNGNENTTGAIVSASLLKAGYGFGRANITLSAYIDPNVSELDVSPYNWEAIGQRAATYAGHFDGSSKPIKGVSMKATATEYQGFFGGVVPSGGESNKLVIENVKLVDPIIEAWDLNRVGGIIGYASRVEVHNCHIVAATTGAPVGHIKIATEKGESKKIYLGGIVGQIVGSSHYNEKSMIVDCINEMPVINETGGDAVGGIVGHVNETYVINCSNAGDITGKVSAASTTPANYGGIVGHIGSNCEDFQIIGCSNSGTISAGSFIGGIVGYAQAENSGDMARVLASYNIGTIVATGEFVGGVIGGTKEKVYIDVIGCYNYGQLYSSYQGTNGHFGAVIGGFGWGDASSTGNTEYNTVSQSYFVYNPYLANPEMANPATWAIGINASHADKASSVNQGKAIEDSEQGVENIPDDPDDNNMSTLNTLNKTFLDKMNDKLEAYYATDENGDADVSVGIKDKSGYWYGFKAGANIDDNYPTIEVISSTN